MKSNNIKCIEDLSAMAATFAVTEGRTVVDAMSVMTMASYIFAPSNDHLSKPERIACLGKAVEVFSAVIAAK